MLPATKGMVDGGMDPLTAFAIATLMMLLNGGVLGLIHRDLPDALRPSAKSWRIGTLLMAAGCVLLAVQHALVSQLALPLANGALMLGLTGYWRSLRQFDGLPDRWWMLLPLVFGTIGISWFVTVSPNLPMRVVVASITWIVIFAGCMQVLRRGLGADRVSSRQVLIGIFVALTVFMMLRAWIFLAAAGGIGDILDSRFWMNMATPIVASILPVIGTTAFLLMCSERIRRDWEHAASTDALTGLANRRTITRKGNEFLDRARSGRAEFALAIVDIDHFKSINDRYGHEVGDLALRHVAQTLARASGPEALPGRQGGEEFVLLLPLAPEPAQAAAEFVRETIAAARLRVDSGELAMTVSIGLTTLQPEDKALDDLMRRADHALYAAKSGGRNCLVRA